MSLFFKHLLLKVDEMSEGNKKKLLRLGNVLRFQERNADIYHRWCELIILCGWKNEFHHLAHFLTQHQAMGVYLYNEMFFSPDVSLQQLALSTLQSLRSELDANTRANVENMMRS